jgi:hypothetical protein
VQGHLFGKATAKPNLKPLAKGFWDAVQQITPHEAATTMASATSIPCE